MTPPLLCGVPHTPHWHTKPPTSISIAQHYDIVSSLLTELLNIQTNAVERLQLETNINVKLDKK